MGAGSSELPAYAVATQEGEGTASSFVEPAGRGAALRQPRVTSNREQLALAHAHCARAGTRIRTMDFSVADALLHGGNSPCASSDHHALGLQFWITQHGAHWPQAQRSDKTIKLTYSAAAPLVKLMKA